MLTKRQQQQISEIINSNGLNHLDFKPIEVKSKNTPSINSLRLKYKDTAYYFYFDLLRGSHWVKFSPAEDRLEKQEYPGNWDLTLGYVKAWVGYLKLEIDTPNVWEKFRKLGKVVPNSETDNTPFNSVELGMIATKISLTKQEVLKLGLPEEEIKEIHEKLDYVYEKAKTMGRLDWRSIFIGLFLQLAVPPDSLKIIIKLLGATFNTLFLAK